MLTEGKSEQEIKDYFVAQYGDRVLGTPPARGLTINWLVHIVPPLALLAGVFVLYRALKEWQRPKRDTIIEAGRPDQQPEDEYMRRMEEELRKQSR
jgi:cytochrome c-type biogenesis protein CcmH